MRLMLAAILVAVTAWSGYWWIGARGEAEDVRAWFGARGAADLAGASTAGFPNRFDTTVTEPSLTLGGVTWGAPFLQTLRLSYRPDHYILALADTQRLDLPGQRITLDTASARASVVFDGERMDRSRFVLDEVKMTSTANWTGAARRILFAARATTGGRKIGLDIEGLDFGETAAVRLHAEGTVQIDPAGHAAGSVEIVSNAWPEVLDFAAAQGWITPEQEKIIGASADGPAIVLTLRGGTAYLGPVALGRMPPLDLH